MLDIQERVALAARESYGSLLAWLTSRCGSIAMAEDALGDALAAALDQWPREGLPRNPQGWLLSVARRRLIDRRRRDTTLDHARADLEHAAQLRLHQEAAEASAVPFRSQLPERRLELMFMCAHPEIPEAMRTPLMLQAVLGLTAQEIASSLLVAPATIGQRLVRVKRLIVERRIPFEVPRGRELPGRLRHVLDAIYAAYARGWEDAPDECGYRLWLAGLLVRSMPESAEAKGLYALLCFCESRRDARRSADGSYVPLEEQDTSRWDSEMIREGKKALWLAVRHDDHGYYQAEASIQMVHADRARSGYTDWGLIHGEYRRLVARSPSLGARIGYAASFGRVGEPAGGLAVLDALDAATVRHHQPYWAVRAWLLARCGRVDEADHAYQQAIGLAGDPAVRSWLAKRRAALAGEAGVGIAQS